MHCDAHDAAPAPPTSKASVPSSIPPVSIVVIAFFSYRLSERVSQLQNPGSRKRCENCTIVPRQCGKEVISACHPKNRVQLKGRKKKMTLMEGRKNRQTESPDLRKKKKPKKSGMTCLEATVQFVSSHFRRGLPRLLFVVSRGSEVKKRSSQEDKLQACGVGGSTFQVRHNMVIA